MMPQQYCLRWKHHHSNVQSMFAQLLEKERFCDVTLYCSPNFATQVPTKDTVEPQKIRGVSLRAHRVVLAACSELLGALLGAHEAHGEPVLVIDGAEPRHLRALLDYMYTGEMNVHHSQLASLLKTAEELRIKGLTDIRWNNKDEPPDSEAGIITTTHTDIRPPEKHSEAKPPPKHASPKHSSPKHTSPKHTSPKHSSPKRTPEPEPRPFKIEDCESDGKHEKFSVNGGPPPLIKLPLKEKLSPMKRENSDSDSPSPKRQRFISGTEHTDDDSVSVTKSERDQEWQHGNLVSDISAERVVGWGMADVSRDSSRDGSDDEWADAPADIGSFLHTRLRVDGDNSADEESNDSTAGAASRPPAPSSSSSASASAAASLDMQAEASKAQLAQYSRSTMGPKSGPNDNRFTDVVKLSEYLQHGRRPQFWEENYVKRVMEAVRLKELEMKQAAEILGVSYGTLYGRYRDVYGCINRPYSSVGGRAVRDYWQAKAPTEVLERLQRGEVSLDAAAHALGVSIANLAAHVADFGVPEKVVVARPVLERLQRGELSLDAAARALGVNAANVAAHVADYGAIEKEFEPIPIEIDPSLKNRSRTYSSSAVPTKPRKTTQDKLIKKIMVGSLTDEDPIPATVITTQDVKPAVASGKWPTIRVASLETLRETPAPPTCSPSPSPAPSSSASPSQLMRTRPDLTIVAARRPPSDRKDDDLPT